MSTNTEIAGTPHTLSAADWRRLVAEAPLLFEVISDSMLPVFAKGERIRIRPLAPDEPRPGQVVAFLRGILVTHRYLGHGRYRGDNTLTADIGVSRDDIVGIVFAVLRAGQELAVPQHTCAAMLLNRLRLTVSKAASTLRQLP